MSGIHRALLRVAAVSGGGAALVFLAAGPAAAADAISVQPNVSTVTSNQTLKVTATADPSLNGGSVALTVTDPAGSTHTVATGTRNQLNQTSLSWSFDTACPSYPGAACSGYAPGLNGSWRFAMGSATRTLTLAVPPAQVQGVQASAEQSRATISWQPNVEPDLRAYDVLTTGDQPVATGIDPGQACANGTCAVSIDFGPQASGTYQFVVRAERATCPSCSSTLSSPDSAPSQSVTFTQPTPSPSASAGGTSSPSAAPSGSGGSGGSGGSASGSSGGSTGGATSAGSTTSSGSAPTSAKASGGSLSTSLRRFTPAQTMPLPPPPHQALPGMPQTVLQPIPFGTYKPTLAYPEQTTREVVQQQARRPVVAEVGTALTRVVGMPALWRSLAAAALLLLVAAHLRAWLARSGIEQ